MDTITAIENVKVEDYPRGHLGASQIGHPCMRYLVYKFHWAYKESHSPQLIRIFAMGNAVEQIIIDAIKSANIHVKSTQLQIDRGEYGHEGGSIDGIVTNVPEHPGEDLLFEGKSMNQNNFSKVVKYGVKEAKPMHYSQMQKYLGKLKLLHSMYVVLNKNTCELYIEFVKYDHTHYLLMEMKGKEIIEATRINEFMKLSKNESWYECKGCDAREVCHKNAKIPSNCRTCKNVEKHSEGEWVCSINNYKVLSLTEQKKGCDQWDLAAMWM